MHWVLMWMICTKEELTSFRKRINVSWVWIKILPGVLFDCPLSWCCSEDISLARYSNCNLEFIISVRIIKFWYLSHKVLGLDIYIKIIPEIIENSCLAKIHLFSVFLIKTANHTDASRLASRKCLVIPFDLNWVNWKKSKVSWLTIWYFKSVY